MQKTAQREVEKLNGGGNLQGIWGRGLGGPSVRSGIVWCLVPCGDGESEAGFSSGALVSPLSHKARWLSTSVSPEKISFDRDFKGFFNLDKSTSALLCVAKRVLLC